MGPGLQGDHPGLGVWEQEGAQAGTEQLSPSLPGEALKSQYQ